MADIAFLRDLLQSQPLYKKVSISLEEYQAAAQSTELPIEGICFCCKKERTFLAPNIKAELRPLNSELLKHTPRPGVVVINPDICHRDGADSYASKFIGLTFRCVHCSEEHYYAVKFDGKTVCKIGQYPSFSRMENANLKKYKKLLDKYYFELTTSVNLYSHGAGIGAFVYLRRILEHLVETKYLALPEHQERAKFIEKLQAVELHEEVIPSELEELKAQLYSVLSKGIHEYSEQDCNGLFDAVLFVIQSILDKELEKKESAKKAVQARNIIAAKLKNKEQGGC